MNETQTNPSRDDSPASAPSPAPELAAARLVSRLLPGTRRQRVAAALRAGRLRAVAAEDVLDAEHIVALARESVNLLVELALALPHSTSPPARSSPRRRSLAHRSHWLGWPHWWRPTSAHISSCCWCMRASMRWRSWRSAAGRGLASACPGRSIVPRPTNSSPAAAISSSTTPRWWHHGMGIVVTALRPNLGAALWLGIRR